MERRVTAADPKEYVLHFIAFLLNRGVIQNGCAAYSEVNRMLRLYCVGYTRIKMNMTDLVLSLSQMRYIQSFDPSGNILFTMEMHREIDAITKRVENIDATTKQVLKVKELKSIRKERPSKTTDSPSMNVFADMKDMTVNIEDVLKTMNTSVEKTSENNFNLGGIGMAPDLRLPPYKIPPDLRVVLNKHLKPFTDMTNKHQEHLTYLRELLSAQELEQSEYPKQLKTLQYLEEHQRELEMRDFDLFEQKIFPTKDGGKIFLVYVPGLAEERPSVRVKDEIELIEANNENYCLSHVKFVGEKYVQTEVSTGFRKKFKETQRYKVRFLLPRRSIQCCQYAIEQVNKNQLVPALFPKLVPSYNKPTKNLSWFDKNVGQNEEQKQAVNNIVARTSHPAPYLLFGPPGTGKTSTIVEAISQVWETDPSSRTLVCTPSNAAADEITKRLLKNNIPPRDIYRMYAPSRQACDVDPQILPSSNFIGNEIIFLRKDLVILKRIVITTLVTCARLLALKLRESHFSYVFVDEGGQATEPETLIPLVLMSGPDAGHRGKLQGQLVIAGDPKQLGPSIRSTHARSLMEKSMLERLMDQCEPYKRNESGKYNPTYITKLVKNFRSNQAILHVPNELFYDNELRACGGAETQRGMLWSKLPKKNFPVIFHAVYGSERREDYSPSVCNMEEVTVILNYVKSLMGTKLGGKKIKQEDIGIVTPYKLQRSKVLNQLSKHGWNDVTVGTVEVFQGQERTVIILSTVRSVMFMHNGNEHIGFLSNPKRFNVAVTRAKALLITIGNPKILQIDKCWNELIHYCHENKACCGSAFSLNQKLTKREKKQLLGKRYVPKKCWDTQFELQIEEEVVVKKPTNAIPENEAPRRRRRMPKINEERTTVVSPESDSGVTSGSNSNMTTDADMEAQAGSSSVEEAQTMTDEVQEEEDSMNPSELMNSDDVGDTERETMRGDTVGDTMYSGKWIINVLISLSNVYDKGWSESLENDLCVLWDMTAEKDVALFLMENDFLKISDFSLKISEEPRMTEIIVGIIGNMCCQSTVLQALAEKNEQVSMIFNLLKSDDTETLIQLVRLLHTAVWDIQHNSQSMWLNHFKNCEILGSALLFIMNSSTSDDLLVAAIDLLQSISSTDLPNENFLQTLFNIRELIPALLEAFSQIIPKQDGNHTQSELKVIENWLAILSNIIQMDQLTFIGQEGSQNFTRIMDVVLRILQPYVHSYNLIPLDERSARSIHDCVQKVLGFQQHKLPVGPEIVFIIVTIMFHLKSAAVEKQEGFETDSIDNEKELLKYLERYWLEVLGMYETNQLQDVLQMSQEDIVKYLMEMTKCHPEVTNDKIEKLAMVESLNKAM